MGLKQWADKNKPGGETMLANQAKRAEKREQLKDQIATRAANKTPRPDRFEGVTLTPTNVSYKGQGGPLTGATAHVETAADARRRITATRVLAIGVFALAAKKQTGHLYLTVEHPQYTFTVEIPVKKETQARAFAAKINTAARRAA